MRQEGSAAGDIPDATSCRDAAVIPRTHPGFHAAAHVAASRLVDAYNSNGLMNRVLNDRGRAVIGLLALSLHFCGGPPGLTLGRLQKLCIETGVCSQGRAAAMLALMEFARYLAPAADVADRRIRRLVPTEKLITAHRDRWSGLLEALSLLAPECAGAVSGLEDQRFLAPFLRQQLQYFRAGFRIMHQVPNLGAYVERTSGLMVLLFLLLAAGENPAPVPCLISISYLSQRFSVSRAQVRALLRQCERDGFIKRNPDEPEQIVAMPLLIEMLELFLASVLAYLKLCAASALDEVMRNQGGCPIDGTAQGFAIQYQAPFVGPAAMPKQG